MSNKKLYKIVGADRAIKFKKKFKTKEALVKKAHDIWDNPEKYWDFEEDEDYYYEFLKFLWIDDIQLAGLVNEKPIEENYLKTEE